MPTWGVALPVAERLSDTTGVPNSSSFPLAGQMGSGESSQARQCRQLWWEELDKEGQGQALWAGRGQPPLSWPPPSAAPWHLSLLCSLPISLFCNCLFSEL